MMRAGLFRQSARHGALPDRLARAREVRAATEAAVAARRARSLVVEFYGAPAAGKTTLALALGRALEQEGMPVRVVTSARPAERVAATGAWAGGRLAAPFLRATKIAHAVRALLPGAAPAEIVELLDLMRPQGRLRTMRLRRYAIELHRAWCSAVGGDAIVIFDQGFLNLLCSIALSARATDRQSLRRGLSLIRAPDLAIMLDAPRQLVEARLVERLDSQTLPERLLENDIEMGFLQAELATILHGILLERGSRAMRVSSIDAPGLSFAVAAITREIRSCTEGGAC